MGETGGKSNGMNGAGAHPPSTPDDGVSPAPAEVREAYAACVRFVSSKYGVALDGEPETLSLVDQYVRDARADVIARPESLELLTTTIGAYLGEVIRVRFGGEWVLAKDPEAWRLTLSTVYLWFNPLGMAREALTMQDEPGWNAHLTTDEAERDAIDARLRAMPEVDAEDFLLPTSRYDVVEIVVEALRASMEARGLGDIRFAPGDYE